MKRCSPGAHDSSSDSQCDENLTTVTGPSLPAGANNHWFKFGEKTQMFRETSPEEGNWFFLREFTNVAVYSLTRILHQVR